MKKGLYLFFVMTMFSRTFDIDTSEFKDLIPPAVEKIQEGNTSVISLVGDLLMDGSIRAEIDRKGYDYPWEMVKEYFIEDDLTIGNLETSITNKGEKWEDKQYNFRSDPKNLAAMKDAAIEVVSLANNHTLDYGYEGLLDTLDNLDTYKIKGVGGGRNKEEASKPLILNIKDNKIGILSFSRVIPDVDWYATNKRPGLVGAYDVHIPEVLKTVEKVKEEVDILIMSIHWGIEREEYPRSQEIQLARKLVDSGVDIVMGHHPHVLQGIEIYKDKPIFYSLGNFVFGSKSGPTSNTMIAQIKLNGKEMEGVRIIPCEIENGRPIPVYGEKREKKINYLNKISKDFNGNISQEGIIKLKK